MNIHEWLVTGMCLVSLGLAQSSAAADDSQRIKPDQTWSGVVQDESLRRQVPYGGTDERVRDFKMKVDRVITDRTQLTRLWNAWRGEKEAVPEVDFVRHIVVVVTASGGGKVDAVAELDKNGDLRVYEWSESVNAKGFGYQIALISRKGVKTVGGRRIPCGRDHCGCWMDGGRQVGVSVETEALGKKLVGHCWSDLAQYEVHKNDRDLHDRVLADALADAKKTGKLVFYISNPGVPGHSHWKACLADPAVMKELRKHFVVISVPFTQLTKAGNGIRVHALSPSGEKLHEFNWGSFYHHCKRLPYLEADHDANIADLKKFLEEAADKAKMNEPK